LRLSTRPDERRLFLTAASFFALLILVLSATRVFAAIPPTLTANPNVFGNGTTVMVSGSGFNGGTNVKIWLDANGNGKLDSGEPTTSTTVASDGTFTDAPLLVTGVANGVYSIDSGPSTGDVAQVPVTVTDPTILTALTADLATLKSDLEGNFATQLASLQAHFDGEIAALQADLDGQLSSIQSSLSSIQNSVNNLPNSGQVQQSYSASGKCTLDPDNTFYGGNDVACGTFHISTGNNNPWPEAVYTITMSIESTGLEAGGSVYIGTDSARIDAAHCDVGTCGLDGFTTTVASTGINIWASCGGPTDSCDTPIVMDYTIVGVAATSGQSLTCTTYFSNIFC
jgi:hypothetical protein